MRSGKSLRLRTLLFGASLLATSAFAYDPDYEKIFPHFIEFSAGTQIKRGADVGGIGGHAVVFIKGLCKDFSVNYPRVKVCDPNEKQVFPHDGVGITVDSQFENVNWTAVPGYEFFMNGELPPGTKVTQAEVDRVIRTAVDRRVFEGVKMKPSTVSRDLAPGDYVREMADRSVGTDFSLTFGRTMNSHRVPISANRLQKIADMLNARNVPYLSGAKKYVWDMLKNNCAHLSAMIFSVAGIRNPIHQDLEKYEQIFNLAIPGNGLPTIQDKTNFRDIDPMTVWKSDPQLRDSILTEGELPVGAGSLTERHFVVSDNGVFDTKLSRLVLPPKPLLRSYCVYGNYLKSFREAEYSDLGRNIEFWQDKFKTALSKINPGKCGRNSTCVDFMEKYEAVLRKTILRTEDQLMQIRGIVKK